MHSLNNRGVHTENLRVLPNCDTIKMDYRQNIIATSSQKLKTHNDDEDDDDEDLEALRLAALKSLRVKNTLRINDKTCQITNQHNNHRVVNYQSFNVYGNRKSGNRGFYQNRFNQQNGNVYHQSRSNQNLIEIVPMEDEVMNKDHSTNEENIANRDIRDNTDVEDDSKFGRYTDNPSGSDEDDTKESTIVSSQAILLTPLSDDGDKKNLCDFEIVIEKDATSCSEDSRRDDLPKNPVEVDELGEIEEPEEDEDEDEGSSSPKFKTEDDDDVLLMADFEEEDSLERLMNEMEREMNVEKIVEKKENKKIRKDSRKPIKEPKTDKNTLPSAQFKENTILRGSSPRPLSRKFQKRRSLSPKLRRKKLSPRRSPIRQSHKSSISRRFSPRRSPNRSPLRKLSPRCRSRSPKRSNISRSPRNRSPMRLSPQRSSPRGRSPRRSPIRAARSPTQRLRTPTRSPQLKLSPLRRFSPKRCVSPRSRSPVKISPDRRRSSPIKITRSPESMSPRRKRSPKDSTRKKITVTSNDTHVNKRDDDEKSTDDNKIKSKTINSTNKDIDATNNPIFEARKRKFQSTKIIDPINDNKKIKLGKRDSEEKIDDDDDDDEDDDNMTEIFVDEKIDDYNDDYDIDNSDLCLTENYVYEVLENFDDNQRDDDIVDDNDNDDNVVEESVDIVTVKTDKIKSKKKKKRDKELYQAGKHRNELPLSERIGKEKKCKKRKDKLNSPILVSTDLTSANNTTGEDSNNVDEEADLRTELSRRRAERLNRSVPVQSARLLQSAFKGVVKEVAKTNAKANQRQPLKIDDKSNKKEVRRVTVLHRTVADLPDSEDEVLDSKVPVRFRLGLNKSVVQDSSSSSRAIGGGGAVRGEAIEVSRKSSKRQVRKIKHKSNMSLSDHDRKTQ